MRQTNDFTIPSDLQIARVHIRGSPRTNNLEYPGLGLFIFYHISNAVWFWKSLAADDAQWNALR